MPIPSLPRHQNPDSKTHDQTPFHSFCLVGLGPSLGWQPGHLGRRIGLGWGHLAQDLPRKNMDGKKWTVEQTKLKKQKRILSLDLTKHLNY